MLGALLHHPHRIIVNKDGGGYFLEAYGANGLSAFCYLHKIAFALQVGAFFDFLQGPFVLALLAAPVPVRKVGLQ
jgi:hypothetical protein